VREMPLAVLAVLAVIAVLGVFPWLSLLSSTLALPPLFYLSLSNRSLRQQPPSLSPPIPPITLSRSTAGARSTELEGLSLEGLWWHDWGRDLSRDSISAL